MNIYKKGRILRVSILLISTTLISIVFFLICRNNYHDSFKYNLISRFLSNSKFNIDNPSNEFICQELQQKINNIINPNKSPWSITALDSKGNTLVSINSTFPRIPASNQKLITTAYSLDKLGPNFRLKTTLYHNKYNDIYELIGEGDPDLSPIHIKQFSSSFYEHVMKYREKYSSYQFYLYEENPLHWWPKDWGLVDRKEAYGAPITRLALTSNATNGAVLRPKERLLKLFKNYNSLLGVDTSFSFPRQDRFRRFLQPRTKLKVIYSAPMRALLSLANSESHNFTSEVLLRHASQNWNVEQSSLKLEHWLKNKGIPTKGFVVTDGSGLSRANRVTSYGLAHLLLKMNNHRFSKLYRSSMAIIGVRGTLSGMYVNSELKNRFTGKTGTLTGIRSLTGILDTINGNIFVSIISYNAIEPEKKIESILSEIRIANYCM